MRENTFLKQVFYSLVILYFSVYLTDGIYQRSYPRNRQKLSSLIITRDQIRGPALYGPPGTTAAEFLVSAGLDTSKSAVRIRRVRRQDNENSSLITAGQRIRNNSKTAESYLSDLKPNEGFSSKRLQYRLQRRLNLQLSTSGNTSHFNESTANRPLAKPAEGHGLRSFLVNFTGPLLRYLLSPASPDGVLERSYPEVIHHTFERIQQKQNNSIINSRDGLIHNSSLISDPSLRRKISNVTVPLLRHLIASHLLQGVLNLRNISASIMNNTTPHSTLDNFYIASSFPLEPHESMTRSEQRYHGMMMTPYTQHPQQYPYTPKRLPQTILPTATPRVPVYRVLKGKLVPIAPVSSDIVPLVLDNQKTSPSFEDDPKLTEDLLYSAIYALLQSEDLLHLGLGGLGSSSNILNTGSVSKRRKVHPTSQPIPMKPIESYFSPTREPRCDRLTEEICLEDSDYPSSAIMSSIYKDKKKFDLMYAEIKERESQVDGLSRVQEQSYNYEHYYGAGSSTGSLRNRDYSSRGGFVCPSEVHYGRPHRAKNKKREWKVVVNVAEYTQTIRMEKCLSANLPCKYVVNKIHSTCSQVYSYHRLLVFSKEQGLHIDAFRIPTGCTCHIRGHKYIFPQPIRGSEDFGGHVESAPQPQAVAEGGAQTQKKNSFGNTLWAILGGGQQAGTLAQSPQFLEEVQKHIGWTQNLKPYPQILQHVSPAQVLKQLLEDDDEVLSIRRQPVRHRPSPLAIDVGSHNLANHHLPIIIRAPSIREQTTVVRKAPPLPRRPVAVDYHHTYVGVPVRAAANSVPIMVKPGMYFTPSDVSKSEDKSSAGAQFPDTVEEESEFQPVSKPLVSKEVSRKEETKDEDDGDLLALEKTESTSDVLRVDNLPSSDKKDSSEENETKINFSYHPILEYLSLS